MSLSIAINVFIKLHPVIMIILSKALPTFGGSEKVAKLKSTAWFQNMVREERNCQCGRTKIGEMRPLVLTSTHREPVFLWYDRENPLGSGTYSQVFHAELYQIGNTRFEKCVALKMTKIDLKSSDWQTHKKEWKIQLAFGKMPPSRRRHIIQLIAYGHHTTKSSGETYVYSVLQLGNHDLVQHMKEKRYEWVNNINTPLIDHYIETELQQVVLAVQDIHQKIMHLDLKPANLVYVKEGNKKGDEKMVLKVIDFGASQFIDEEQQEEETEQNQREVDRANVCRWFVTNDPLTTAYYQSPEHVQQCNWEQRGSREHAMELSAKSDIWAVGIILYEMVLVSTGFRDERRRHSPATRDLETIMRRVYAIMNRLSQMYLHVPKSLNKKMDSEWSKMFTIFVVILATRQDHPRLFHIITGILKHSPEERPTAKGILDFLQGKCQLIRPDAEPMILPWLSLETLKRSLMRKRRKLEESVGVLEQLKQKTKEPMKMIRQVDLLIGMTEVPDWDQSGQTKVPCETATTTPKMAKTKGNALQIKSGKDDRCAEAKLLQKLEKTIGLSVSPSIQSADRAARLMFQGLLENLQDSFYNRDMTLVRTMGDNSGKMLATMGYNRLLEQLDSIFARYKSDARHLRKLVMKGRLKINKHWQDLYQRSLSYAKNDQDQEQDESSNVYRVMVDRVGAVQLYQMVYRDLQTELGTKNFQCERGQFMVDWLEEMDNKLSEYANEMQDIMLDKIQKHRMILTRNAIELQNSYIKTMDRRNLEYVAQMTELRNNCAEKEQEINTLTAQLDQIGKKWLENRQKDDKIASGDASEAKVASGRKDVRKDASGHKDVPTDASGEKVVPKVASDEKDVPKVASGRKDVRKDASIRKDMSKDASGHLYKMGQLQERLNDSRKRLTELEERCRRAEERHLQEMRTERQEQAQRVRITEDAFELNELMAQQFMDDANGAWFGRT